MTEPSPVDRALRGLNLTTLDTALAADITPSEVSCARRGGHVPGKLVALLREAGVGIDDLLLEQQRYRTRQAAEIRERVSGRGAARREFEERTVTREAAGGCVK